MMRPARRSPGDDPPPAQAGEPPVAVDRLPDAAQRHAELLEGLLQPVATIAPKYFYDEQGSALYAAIVALDEYYLPRLEHAIFEQHGEAIAALLPREAQWVDLGCGDGRKSLRWIEALAVRRYVGVDIAEPWLRETLRSMAQRYGGLELQGVVTDFARGLRLRPWVQASRPAVFYYPGSSIGNFAPLEAVALLRELRGQMAPQDRLLVAVDGVKPRVALVAAYDDALGVTAAFNRNVLRVANRVLGADFDPAAFKHEADYDEVHARIEMRLVARREQRVRLGQAARRFEHGEAIITEHSYKYSAPAFADLLAQAGFASCRHFCDDGAGYHVFVAAPA